MGALDFREVPEFSPRMWRCFSVAIPYRSAVSIFSTYVEVFRVT